MTDPSPPPTLGRAGRDLWHLVQAEYEFGPGEDQLLEAVVPPTSATSRPTVIDLEGVVVSSPQGQKANRGCGGKTGRRPSPGAWRQLTSNYGTRTW